MIIKFLQLHRRKNHEKTGPGWEKTDAGEQADEIHTVQGDRMSQRRPPTNYFEKGCIQRGYHTSNKQRNEQLLFSIKNKLFIFDELNRIEQTKLLFDSTRIRIYILNSIRLDLASNRIRFGVRKFDRSSRKIQDNHLSPSSKLSLSKSS